MDCCSKCSHDFSMQSLFKLYLFLSWLVGEYSRCEMYNLEYSSYSQEQFNNWNRSAMLSRNVTKRRCSSWVYDTSEYNSLVDKVSSSTHIIRTTCVTKVFVIYLDWSCHLCTEAGSEWYWETSLNSELLHILGRKWPPTPMKVAGNSIPRPMEIAQIIKIALKSPLRFFLSFVRNQVYSNGFFRNGIVTFSSLRNLIMFQWDLVCDRAYLVSMLQTVYMAGFLVGCVFYGQISDR